MRKNTAIKLKKFSALIVIILLGSASAFSSVKALGDASGLSTNECGDAACMLACEKLNCLPSQTCTPDIKDTIFTNYHCIDKPTALEPVAEPELTKPIDELIAPQNSIYIPYLKYTPIDPKLALDEQGYLYLPWIGEFLSAIYKTGIIIGSILAAVMIILAGVRIVASGGSEEKTTAYKDIGRVAVGLLILWGSYLVLSTINPKLVAFNSLRIKYIEPTPWDSSIAVGSIPETGANAGKGQCGGANSHSQTLLDGLNNSLFKLSNYSIVYGATCEKPATIKAIVLHYTASNPKGTPEGVVKWWGDQASPGAICQIVVGRDGTAYQVTEKIEEKVICHGGSRGYNWNTGGVGIEIMGANSDELKANSAQKTKVIELVKKLVAQYNIPLTNGVENLFGGSGGIFSHQEITRCERAPNQKIDPGEEYMKEVLAGVGGTYEDWTQDPRCGNQ